MYRKRSAGKRGGKRRSNTRRRGWRGGEVGSSSIGSDSAAIDRIEQEIEAKNQLFLPALEDVPVVGPIAEKTGELVETAGVKAVDAVGDWIGVDLDNPQSLGDKIDGVTAALSNPQNVQRMKEAAREGAKMGGVMLEAAAPFAEKFVDEAIPIAQSGIEKASKATVATGVNLLEDIAGPLIGIPRTLLSAAEAISATVNAGAGLVKKGSETVDATLENYDRLVQNQSRAITNTTSTFTAPAAAASTAFSSSPRIDQITQLQQQRGMIGGRIHKSTDAFFHPFLGIKNKNKTVRRRSHH